MAQTEEQLQLAENAAEELGLGSVQEAKETLSTKTLSSQPDFAIQEGDTPTAGAALEGAVQAETDAFTEELSRQRKEAEKPVEESRSEIQDILAGIRGETGLQAEAEKEVGLPDVEKELLDINQQLRTEQNALRREIEAIEKNTAGRSAGQVANKIDEVRTESIRKQADLTVIQMGIQGRYDSAKAIADRAVKAQMEKQELVYQTALFNYQENKELYTTAEQREFEALASNRKAEIDAEKEKLQTLSDLSLSALEGGAPASVVTAMRSARDINEAILLGGKYVGAGDRALRQAQIANIYDQMETRKQALREQANEAASQAEKEQLEREANSEQALEIKQLATQLLADEGLSSAVGFGFKKTIIDGLPFVSGDAISGTKRADFEATAERVANLLTLDNLDLMSGVLSETDIKILETAGSNLRNFSQTEEQYKEEVNRIINVMDRNIKKNGITDEQAAFYSGLDDDEISEIDLIFGDVSDTQEAFDPAKFF